MHRPFGFVMGYMRIKDGAIKMTPIQSLENAGTFQQLNPALPGCN